MQGHGIHRNFILDAASKVSCECLLNTVLLFQMKPTDVTIPIMMSVDANASENIP